MKFVITVRPVLDIGNAEKYYGNKMNPSFIHLSKYWILQDVNISGMMHTSRSKFDIPFNTSYMFREKAGRRPLGRSKGAGTSGISPEVLLRAHSYTSVHLYSAYILDR